MIYELVIYDGGMKNYRILNLATGTFYSTEYETLVEAMTAAKKCDGEVRNDNIVRFTTLAEINNALNAVANQQPIDIGENIKPPEKPLSFTALVKYYKKLNGFIVQRSGETYAMAAHLPDQKRIHWFRLVTPVRNYGTYKFEGEGFCDEHSRFWRERQ